MKKITLRVVLVFGFACFGTVAYGQRKDPARQAINDSLAKVFSTQYALEKEKAVQMAAEKGWPLTIEKDGSFSELMRVTPTGAPIYYKTLNAGSAITSRANLLYSSAGMGFSLTGEGMLAGVWDKDHARFTHSTFGGRLSIKDQGSATSEHATHVSGTMIGSGVGNTQARGIAFGGSIWNYDWGSDYSEMTAAASNLCVSNHSYGMDADQVGEDEMYLYGKYILQARQVDLITFNNPYYQPVIAAGNDRGGSVNAAKGGNDLLSEKGIAKNAIVVAAVQQVDDYTGPSSVQIASFSNFGPTDDMRIKPDIAAKGVGVLSSTDSSNSAYATLSGTSMAAPGISGVIILLQQLYSEMHPSEDFDEIILMRSATVRGLLAHTADEIGANDGPDHMTGWGLVNAYKSALIIQNEGESTEVFEENALSNGAEYQFNVTSDGVNPLEATIAWTDRAAAQNNSSAEDVLAANAQTLLINDLDIRIVKVSTGEVYYPWKLTGTLLNPTVTTGDNSVDNIEKIQIPSAAGQYTITVSHKSTLYNSLAQQYSLIVTGITGTNSVDDFADNNITVWPNPVGDVVNVSLTSGAFEANASMAIYDVQGREVLRKGISSNAASANVSQLTAGMYFVKVFSGGSEFVKKIIVK